MIARICSIELIVSFFPPPQGRTYTSMALHAPAPMNIGETQVLSGTN
jgi:hypothetical protein